MKFRKLLFSIIGIFLLLLLFQFILRPAFISTKISCFPDSETTWQTQGETTYNETTGEITILIQDETDKQTIRHEFIHYKQIQRNDRILYCGIFGIKRYFLELEAYTFSYLPDFIYKPIYGDYEMFIN